MNKPANLQEFLQHLDNRLNEVEEDYLNQKGEFKVDWRDYLKSDMSKEDKKNKKRQKRELKRAKADYELIKQFVQDVYDNFRRKGWLKEEKQATVEPSSKSFEFLTRLCDKDGKFVGGLYIERC